MILLLIIYIAFISLGLPDTIIGASIPSFQNNLGIPLSGGGFISLFITAGTVISSFFSEKLINKIGTGKVVFISCLTTGLSLLGFSLSGSYIYLLLFAFPLGLGGGAVDVSLNNYVALNYKAHHMNWLHSFWGVGATLGPLILSWNLVNTSWRGGFRTISFIQLSFALILLITLGVWKNSKNNSDSEEKDNNKLNTKSIKGLKTSFLIMLVYCGAEIGTGLWGSSYLVNFKGLSENQGANFISLYYFGITIGRFISGLFSFKLDNRKLIRYGTLLAIIGVIIFLLPLDGTITGYSLVLVGLGLAPIFPSMIHETPNRFGKELSQKIVGYQMGFAYIGSSVVPPALGLLYQGISISLLPYTIFILLLILFISAEILKKRFDSN